MKIEKVEIDIKVEELSNCCGWDIVNQFCSKILLRQESYKDWSYPPILA